MSKKESTRRFGPEQWVTMRGTGEHVKVESWSAIADVYRVNSRKHGLQFASEGDLEEVCEHPDVHLGRHWSRCQAPGCGAPLTPGLSVCPQCHGLICACGRCQCVRRRAVGKAGQKKPAAKAR